ncbi:MAG: hypothetical protein GNW80_00185 [Asgard group archaeon]|nr:hypothetical protein [Asgard group archaeon]
MTEESDYFHLYMNTVSGTPEPIIRGVLLFFKSIFSNEELSSMERDISHQDAYSLVSTQKILSSQYGVGDETIRQILQLMNKKFKEAIEKKEITSRKLDFIRNVKKKH